MAMTMNGEYQLVVPREMVWEKLNDAETLKTCIPGCEQFDKLSDTEFQAVSTTKIGPVVPSGMRLEFGGGISGNMRLSFQAARSIG
jgi:carbon monoxide dehydrogenase subunit G